MFLTAFSCVQRVLGLGWDKRLLMDEGGSCTGQQAGLAAPAIF